MTSARKKVHADNAINNKQSVNLIEMLIILIKGSFLLIVIQTHTTDGVCRKCNESWLLSTKFTYLRKLNYQFNILSVLFVK